MKASAGTAYQYTRTSSPDSYCVTATSSGISFFVASGSAPAEGRCPGHVDGGSLALTVSSEAGDGTDGFADGQGTDARFAGAMGGIAIDAAGNVYMADTGNHRIRKITPSGLVSTLAGSGVGGYSDGLGVAAEFHDPADVAVDGAGNVYVADQQNQRIRKITPSGFVSTLAGSGVSGYNDALGIAAQFNEPNYIAVSATGTVYVSDSGNGPIRTITPGGLVSTLLDDGSNVVLGSMGIDVDTSGSLYIADFMDHRVRKVSTSGVVSILAGDGTDGYADGFGPAATTASASVPLHRWGGQRCAVRRIEDEHLCGPFRCRLG